MVSTAQADHPPPHGDGGVPDLWFCCMQPGLKVVTRPGFARVVAVRTLRATAAWRKPALLVQQAGGLAPPALLLTRHADAEAAVPTAQWLMCLQACREPEAMAPDQLPTAPAAAAAEGSLRLARCPLRQAAAAAGVC